MVMFNPALLQVAVSDNRCTLRGRGRATIPSFRKRPAVEVFALQSRTGCSAGGTQFMYPFVCGVGASSCEPPALLLMNVKTSKTVAILRMFPAALMSRSEERRVGKE